MPVTSALARSLPTGAAQSARPRSPLDRGAYRHASLLLLAVLATAAVGFAVEGSWFRAAAVGALAVLGLTFIAVKNRLPSIFTLLFLLAGIVNMAGYLFDLWRSPLWFDEAVHGYTSFAIAAAIGWAMLARTALLAEAKGWKVTLSVTLIGLVLGAAWEVFEWIIGIIGSPADTVIDMVMDVIGAILAGLFCAWASEQDHIERNSG